MLRVAAILTGLVVAAWLFLVLAVDLDSDANAATAYVDLTVYAFVVLLLIWFAVGVARVVGRARRSRRHV